MIMFALCLYWAYAWQGVGLPHGTVSPIGLIVSGGDLPARTRINTGHDRLASFRMPTRLMGTMGPI